MDFDRVAQSSASLLDLDSVDDQASDDLVARITRNLSRVAREMGERGEAMDEFDGLGEEVEDVDFDAASESQLASRPTPYEVWAAQHSKTGPTKQTARLSEGEWNDLVSRLNESSKRREVRMMQQQHRKLAEELQGLDFKPRTNKYRLKTARKPLYPGAAGVRGQAEAKERKRRSNLARDMQQVTFHPDLSLTAGPRQQQRTRRSEEQLRRRVAHLQRYGDIRQIRAQQRREIMQRVSAMETTFSPELNKRSQAIYESMQARLAAHQQVSLEAAQRSGIEFLLHEPRRPFAAKPGDVIKLRFHLEAGGRGAGPLVLSMLKGGKVVRDVRRGVDPSLGQVTWTVPAIGRRKGDAPSIKALQLRLSLESNPALFVETPRFTLLTREEGTFQPRVNPRSSALERRQHVFARLYGHARVRHRNRLEQELDAMRSEDPEAAAVVESTLRDRGVSEAIAVATSSPRRAPTVAQTLLLPASATDRGFFSPMRGDGGAAPEDEAGEEEDDESEPPAHVNVVEYRPKHDFIIRRLHAMRQEEAEEERLQAQAEADASDTEAKAADGGGAARELTYPPLGARE